MYKEKTMIIKDIHLGYLNLIRNNFITANQLNHKFTHFLRNYLDIQMYSVVKPKEIVSIFNGIEKHKLNFLFIDYYLLLHAFVLREKLGLNLPFIFSLHTVHNWMSDKFVCVIPLIRKYDVIIAPSKYAKNSFLKISEKFDIQVVPHFIDIRPIKEKISYFFHKNKKVITFMGRLSKDKNIGTLIKCMPSIIANVPNAHLDIIGPLSGSGITNYPKSPFVKKLERDVKKLNLNNRVHFRGTLLGLDKYKTLSKSDLFVNPTVAKEETFGIVNIEALACGLPVIVTNWGGSQEIIVNNKNGYLVNVIYDKFKKPECDTKRLIFLVAKVLKNKKLNFILRKNALRMAKRYDYRKVLPQFINLLKRKKIDAKIENRWNIISNQRISDFNHLFKKDFLFFRYFFNNLQNTTYYLIYNKLFKKNNSKDKKYNYKLATKKTIRLKKLRNKIKASCLDFITKG